MSRLTECSVACLVFIASGCADVPEQLTQVDSPQASTNDPQVMQSLRIAGATVLQEAWAWRATHEEDWDCLEPPGKTSTDESGAAPTEERDCRLEGESTVNHPAFQDLREEILRALLHANVVYHGVTEVPDPTRNGTQLQLTGEPEITIKRHIDNLHIIVRKGDFNGERQYYYIIVSVLRNDQRFSDQTFSIVSAELISQQVSLARVSLVLDEDRRSHSQGQVSRTRDWNDCTNLAAQRGFAGQHVLDATALQNMFCQANPDCDFIDELATNGEWQVLDVNSEVYCTVFNPNVAEEFEPDIIRAVPADEY